MSRRAHLISWSLGVLALVGLIWYFRPPEFLQSVQRVGFAGVAGWLVVTLLARLLFAEVPIRLFRTLGHTLGRLQLFAIGWLRTFSNQVVPMTGIGVYLQQLRQKSGASWQDLAAATTQQSFAGLAALGVIGLVAALANTEVASRAMWPLLLAFAALTAAALGAATGAALILRLLPRFLAEKIATAADSFRRLAADRQVIAGVVGLHAGGILLRGARVWLLFASLGVTLSWQEALLIVALAEATVLIAVTPGGLGIREAIIVGGAALLGIETQTAVAVSLIDRLFVIVVTGLMAGPSAMYLARGARAQVEPQ